MGWNGAGGYDRERNFSADASAGIKILASAMDQELDDVASAFTNCWALDGQNTPSTNMPLGGNRFINVGAAQSVNDYMRVREFVEGVPIYMADTRSSSDYVSVSAQYFTSVSAGQAPTGGTHVRIQVAADKASGAHMIFQGHSANIALMDGNRIDGLVSGATYDFIYNSADSVWETPNRNLIPRTQAEIDAGVTPVNYRYPELNVLRYGTNTTPGTTDMTTAIQNAIDVAAATGYGGEVYVPEDEYLYTGLTITGEDISLVGAGMATVLTYSGSGIGIEVSGHRVAIANIKLKGETNCTAVVVWTAAANGLIDRVYVDANSGTADCVILREGSFYHRIVDSFIDGGTTAARGLWMHDNGAASGPNSSKVKDTRIQQVTTGIDVEDGNNIVLVCVQVENTVTTGARVRAPGRNTVFAFCRFDWNVDNSTGVQVDSGAQDTLLLNTHWDISGSGTTLLSDSGTRTVRGEGNTTVGASVLKPSVKIEDADSDNPLIDLFDSSGRAGLIQTTASLLDLFARTGFGVRVRSDGGNHVLTLLDSSGNVVLTDGALGTTDTDGFVYAPTCAGTPTGTPTSKTGAAPIVIDTTNHKLYFYSGGSWRDAGPA